MKWIINSFEFSQPEEQEIYINSLIPINSLLSYVFKKKIKGIFFISLTKKKNSQYHIFMAIIHMIFKNMLENLEQHLSCV